MKNYWLIKTEASCYSIEDLKKDGVTPWSGIRNYQARNFMMNDMQPGDLCLVYYSNGTPIDPSGVVGIASVANRAHPDMTAQDPKDEHFDKKATAAKPIWYCVDVQYKEKFKNFISLAEIKRNPKLKGIAVAERGSRLSIQPVSEAHFKIITQAGEGL